MTTENKMKHKDNIWYNGIEGVLKDGVDVSRYYTRENLIEIIKCKEDPVYFIENYVKIQTDNGMELFKLRSFQKEMIIKYNDNRMIISKVARQMGKTICSSAYFLWFSIFHNKKKTLILANKKELTDEIIMKIKDMIQELPLFLTMGVKAWNQSTIHFSNGSIIKASATSGSSGRGSKNDIVYCDELAFVPKNILEEFMMSVYPSITSSEKSKFIITSTPNGYNAFYKIFVGAERGENGFEYVQAKWDVDGIRGEDFKRDIIDKFGERYFNQEFECLWTSRSDSMLNSKQLEKLEFKTPIEEREIYKENYILKIFEQPIKDDKYILTIDPAEGLGKDYTAMHVFNITDRKIKQVATFYNNNIHPREVPYVAVEIAILYNKPLIITEVNKYESIGEDIIIDMEYDNVFINRDDGRYGVHMSQVKRTDGLKQMVLELDKGNIIINDIETIHELSVFIYKNGKYQADEGEHDDLVTSMNLLTWLMSDKERYKEYIESGIKYMRDRLGLEVKDDFHFDFALFDNGIEKTSDKSEFHKVFPFLRNVGIIKNK